VRLGALAPVATARASDGGCAGKGHNGRNTLWRPGNDEGKQRQFVTVFDGGR
jgi:hypothetical protein